MFQALCGRYWNFEVIHCILRPWPRAWYGRSVHISGEQMNVSNLISANAVDSILIILKFVCKSKSQVAQYVKNPPDIKVPHFPNHTSYEYRVLSLLFFFLTLQCYLTQFSSLSLTSQSSKEALSGGQRHWGIALLPTFFYVATVHVLLRWAWMGTNPTPLEGEALASSEVAALVLGCLIPLVLSIDISIN